MTFRLAAATFLLALSLPTAAHADENLFGYNIGAETLPKGAGELYLFNTLRTGKGQGHYRAIDSEIEGEYGITDRIQLSAAANFLTIDTHGLIIDGYLPKPIDEGPRFSGLELTAKFNVMAPALDAFGLAVITSAEWSRLDPHSGQRKTEWEGKVMLAAQKYWMQGRMIWVGNIGLKAGIEDRKAIAGLDPGIEWPTTPETEIEVSAGTGLAYRILPGWFIGAEAQYATEFETEVGQERWSLFAGPTIHYGGKKLWATLTWFPQLKGGGERYPGQTGQLHLIEKTKNEVRLKLGLNF
jgi:uncharacterized protein DUF6662